MPLKRQNFIFAIRILVTSKKYNDDKTKWLKPFKIPLFFDRIYDYHNILIMIQFYDKMLVLRYLTHPNQ